MAKEPRQMRPPKVRHARLPDVVLPEMLEGALCSVRMLGNGCVLVENHRGLSALGQECISVMTKCGPLEVRGEDLSLCEVRNDALVVRGRICAVRYVNG